MDEFKITRTLVKEVVQDYHNDTEQNGSLDINHVKDAVLEELRTHLSEWYDALDWDEIEQEILEDDRGAKEDYRERKQEYEEMQGWR